MLPYSMDQKYICKYLHVRVSFKCNMTHIRVFRLGHERYDTNYGIVSVHGLDIRYYVPLRLLWNLPIHCLPVHFRRITVVMMHFATSLPCLFKVLNPE